MYTDISGQGQSAERLLSPKCCIDDPIEVESSVIMNIVWLSFDWTQSRNRSHTPCTPMRHTLSKFNGCVLFPCEGALGAISLHKAVAQTDGFTANWTLCM